MQREAIPALELVTAVASLGDELARQIRICERVLQLESDRDIRREAANRYAALMTRREAESSPGATRKAKQ